MELPVLQTYERNITQGAPPQPLPSHCAQTQVLQPSCCFLLLINQVNGYILFTIKAACQEVKL